MEDSEPDFDFGAWCPVCDRAIPTPHAAPTPAVAAGQTQVSPDLRRATSGSSHAPSTSAVGGTSKPKDKKKSRDHHAGGGPIAGGLTQRRNKSSTKLHHAPNRHASQTRQHSTSHPTLAPLTSAISPPLTPSPPIPPPESEPPAALNPPTSLYCSEECRRIDEMRSRLAFADLGPSARRSTSRQQQSGAGEAEELMASMSRRRNSGASLSAPSFASRPSPPPQLGPSTAAAHWGSSSSLASHSQSSASFSRPPPPLTLDFSTRRNSRGGAEGGYSYRPSLMQRVPSSDDGFSDRNGNLNGWAKGRGSSDSLASMGEADERSDRGFNIRPPSALSAFRFMTPISTTPASSSPPHGSLSARARRPSLMLRNHTDAPRATTFRVDGASARDRAPRSDDDGSITSPPLMNPTMLGRRSGSAPGNLAGHDGQSVSTNGVDSHVGSAHATVPISRSSSTARRPPRSASSASLALMGTSLGRSYVPRSLERHGGWGGPKRSESTASLSDLVAKGNILPVSVLTAPTPGTSLTRNTPIVPRLSTSPSSPSSNSSFARSHSSTRSSRQSTAGSSDHPDHRLSTDYGNFYAPRQTSSSSLAYSPQPEPYLSSSAGSAQHPGSMAPPQRPLPANRGRMSNTSLMMTPSMSSLSGGGSSYGNDGRQTSRLRSESWTAERTPTQSLSKAASLRAVGGSSASLANDDPETTPLASQQQRQRSKDSRGMSTSVATRRPHPGEHHDATLAGNSPPVNAAGVNPALSYLYPNGAPASSTIGMAAPSMLADKSRNWSWDHLPVTTYAALDVDQVRRARAASGGKEAAPQQLPKERKRLFYFSDSGE